MMSPSALLPNESALQKTLNTSTRQDVPEDQKLRLSNLAQTILFNLQYQHDWTNLKLHTTSPLTSSPLSRPMISGLPPKRSYVHPDEQVEVLKAEHANGGDKVEEAMLPELEWVLPTSISESMTLAQFADVFDGVGVLPPGEDGEVEVDTEVGWQWRGKHRQKRILLATLHEDSTVVYYIMHDGIVKPRQN